MFVLLQQQRGDERSCGSEVLALEPIAFGAYSRRKYVAGFVLDFSV